MKLKVMIFLLVTVGVADFSLRYSQIAHATQVTSSTIDNLVDDAEDAFCGVCQDIKLENSETLGPRTTYTFLIRESMKGSHKVGDTITFTQASGFKGATSYVKDREYCLLLAGASRAGGLRAPMGLSNGKFDVTKAPDGARRLRVPAGRQQLFRDVLTRRPTLSKSLSSQERDTVTRTDSGDIDYNDFVSIVRKITTDKPTR